MTITPGQFDKRVAWSRLYDFDFGSFGEFSEAPVQTISVAQVTSSPAGLTVGSPAVVGSRVQVLIGGGVAGTVYDLLCSVTTAPGGYLLSQDGLLNVVT